MANEQRRIPRSYDEIVRRTVVDPDSSVRPTKIQEDEADERFRIARMRAQMTDQERMLYARVAQALLGDHSFGEIGFEVEHGRVTLHGTAGDARTIAYAEAVVREVESVEDVINHIVVRV
jgi:osmotically-inducible protein OsmY